jgi:hypothetical protein
MDTAENVRDCDNAIIFFADILYTKTQNNMNRSKISTAMTKKLLIHESGLMMAKNPELHSFPDSVEQSQNKVQKPSIMKCLGYVKNLRNYKKEEFENR